MSHGWIKTRFIRDAQVTAVKLAAGAVTAASIAAGTITATELAAGAVGSTALAADVEVQSAIVTITSAQLLAMFATPIEIIAAPAAGTAIVVEGIQLQYDFGTAAYAGIAAGEDIAFKYTNASGTVVAAVEATGFIDGVADDFRWAYPATAVITGSAEVTPVAAAALVANMLVGEVITGDGDLHVKVMYRVVTLALV